MINQAPLTQLEHLTEKSRHINHKDIVELKEFITEIHDFISNNVSKHLDISGHVKELESIKTMLSAESFIDSGTSVSVKLAIMEELSYISDRLKWGG